MTINRIRYIAVRDNKTKILMDTKITLRKNGRRLTRQESIDSCWREFNKIGQARILSWHTLNKAKAALEQSYYVEGVDYEIIPMTETFEI